MRTRTLAALYAGLVATTTLAQPPATPPTPPPNPTLPGGLPPTSTPPPQGTYPKEIHGKTLSAWLADLKDSADPAVRQAAISVIPQFGPDAREPALKPLLAAMARERDPGVRLNIIDLVGVIGPTKIEEVRDITKALALALANSGIGGPSRLHLVRALGNYGEAAHEGIPAILTVITDPSWETRRAAAVALGRLGLPHEDHEKKSPTPPDKDKKGPNPSAMKALANTLLKDDSAAVRLEAAQSLLILGPPAFKDPTEYPVVIKPYLEAVHNRLKAEKEKTVSIWLLILLMRYDGTQFTDASITKVAENLTSTDPSVRYHALTALGMLGEKAKPFVPRIAAGLSYQEPELVYHTIATLAALGETAKQSVPDLERFKMVTKDQSLKSVATEAIDHITGKKKIFAPPPPPAAPPKM